MPIYRITEDCLTVYDSYKVRKWNMRPVLRKIKQDTIKPTNVFARSMFSLKMEWICHNFLYNIGYERERTKDTDFDNPCDRPEWQYCLCGILAWIVVW